MAETIQPENNDVLCGRGKYSMQWDGNLYYTELIKKNKERCRFGDDGTKHIIAGDIFKRIRSLSPPGRFLKFVDSHWIELTETQALAKIRQALRDMANGRSFKRRQVTQEKEETSANDKVQWHSEDVNATKKKKRRIVDPTHVDNKVLSKDSHENKSSKLKESMNEDFIFARRIDHRKNHRAPSDESNVPTESELKVNERTQDSREVNLVFDENIKAKKDGLEFAERLRELECTSLPIKQNNNDNAKYQHMPEMVGSETVLNHQNVLPISYSTERLLAIEALENARKSLCQHSYLFHNREMDYYTNDPKIPETIPSDYAIKYIDHDTKPEICDEYESPALKIKQEISEESTKAFREDTKSFTNRETNIVPKKTAKPEIVKSKDNGTNNEAMFQGFTSNQLAVLGIGTDKKRRVARQDTDLFGKRVKTNVTPECIMSETF